MTRVRHPPRSTLRFRPRQLGSSGALLLASVFAGSLATLVSGCGSRAADKPAESAKAAGTKAPIATEEHGPLHALGSAFGEVAITPAQRSEIEKLFKDAEARHAQAKTGSESARKDLLLALAAQVEQGTIDRAALGPKIEAAAGPWTAARTADRAGLERLHAILTPLQRGALVDALEDELSGRGAHRGRGHGKARGGAQHHAHDRAQRWADELALTEAQKDQIKGALRAERGKGHGDEAAKRGPGPHLGRTMEAFREDRFVAAAGTNETATAHEPAERTLRFMEIAVPVLTPAQRTLAAQKLRERAEKADKKD
jgi:Spy/CpxP family protein refolding chaperone